MSLNVNQVGALFGGGYSSPASVYNLLTGAQDVTASLFNTSFLSGSSLTPTQSDVLSGLEEYVKENLSEQDAGKILANISGLKKLFANNNNDVNIDPVLSLLAATGFSKQSGSLVDLFI